MYKGIFRPGSDSARRRHAGDRGGTYKPAWHSRRTSPALLALVLSVLGFLATPLRAMDWIYIVQPGDNLWNLALELTRDLGYWRGLQRLNHVEQPRRLQPGTRLRIPLKWLKVRQGSARIRSVQGHAEYIPVGSRQPQTAVPGLELHPGDALHTGQDGLLRLAFPDGSALDVYPDTKLIMEQLNRYGDPGYTDYRVLVPRGNVEAAVSPEKGANDRYQIRTPAAVTSIRGTELRVHMNDVQETARTEVTQGKVVVGAAGRRVRVPAAHGTVVHKGHPPEPPRPLLPAPDLSTLESPLRRLPLELHWAPLPGAVRYHLRITPESTAERLLVDQMVSAPGATLPDLPDGRYRLHVRGVDSHSLEGLEAQRSFEIDARPVPPFLIAPVHDGIVRARRPSFEWSQVQGGAAYHFQVATDPSFTALLIDREQSAHRYRPKAPWTPGDYYWRVSTRNAEGEEGPFGDVQHFELRPPPAAPDRPLVEAAGDTVTFRWRAGKPGQRYQFQMARDAGFKEILVDRVLDEPQITLPRPQQPRVYLRTRTIDADGYPGPYSPTQFLDKPRWPGWPVLGFALVVLLLAL